MATTKQGSGRKPSSTSRKPSSNGRKPSKPSSTARAKSAPARKSTSTSRPAKKRAKPAKRAPASTNSHRNGGVTDTIKQVANTAKRPAVAVGAAAAGVAGGIVLRSRTRRKTVLGVSMPRGLGKSLSGLDAKSVAKSVGHASKQFAKTTKNVSKDLERAGDQAERIGKILDQTMATTTTRSRSAASTNGTAVKAKQVARKAPAGALAAGAAAAGLAGGLVLGARVKPRHRRLPTARHHVLGLPIGRRSTLLGLVGGARRAAAAAGKASSTADDIHTIREQLEQANRRSPIEIVLDGLTHRRGAHKLVS